ncbi:MAG: DUF3795 domain-containing protein [Oscillospiraceae bacterium]|nr:DUF3795 domain-containing protein [Oscillospiraceae bacterium]
MYFSNAYFIIGNGYAGKSTMIKLLAEKYDGILCDENYHDRYFPDVDREEFPCLSYTRDLEDWHDFIRRTPEEYKAWIDGVSKECEILELRILEDLAKQGKPIFVDTNISVETLKEIADHDHVLVMLADPQITVRQFFERPDREKQFLYQLIMEEPDPEKAMENYRQGLTLINSQEDYDRLLNSGFNVILRDENRSVEETLKLVEKAFGLDGREETDMSENEKIAYCGVNCSVCPDYLEGKCPSCRDTEWKEDDICMPVRCCREKRIEYCGFCDGFPCKEMEAFYNESDSHIDAYLKMCEISGRFDEE